MEKKDVLLRASKVLEDLYDEINSEEWGYDEELYDKQMNDFFIISNLLSILINYRYNENPKTKDEFKINANELIDKLLK